MFRQRAADLTDLRGPERGFDGPADIPEVGFPGGHVRPGGLTRTGRAAGVIFHSDYAEVDVKPENLRMAC